MPIKSYTVGPGQLIVGETGTPRNFTAQVRSCVIKWKKKAEDSLPVLSGEELAGGVVYTASLNATLIQDLTDDGLVDFTWESKGESVPFSFVPSTAEGRSINGVVVVDPIDVGGDVKTKAPTSDIEWDCVGEPTLAADLT